MKLLLSCFFLPLCAVAAPTRIEDVPEHGVQPQVVLDAQRTAHLIYLKGDPKACDVRYVHRGIGGHQWSAPVSVNSQPATAVAMGTIRGAQIALGRSGTLHVVWNGVAQSGGKEHASRLFYTRLAVGQTRIEPQRNLLGETRALDGGASIAADDKGTVFLIWHGKQSGSAEGEAGRVVFVLKSADDGKTFAAPVIANADFTGTCACCSLKSLAMPSGELLTLYRAAHGISDRDLTLLTSRDGGTSFTRKMLDPWKTPTCPMSSAALLATPQGVRGAWESDGKIRSAILDENSVAAEIASGKAKHPSLSANSRGETLVAWTVGTGWNRGGELGWVILDPSGQPTTERGQAPGVPVWSHVACYAEADGGFVILR